MRQIETHKVNGLNEMIEVQVLDEPGPGGACHRYRVCVPIINPAEAHVEENSRRMGTYCDIRFQKGPIAEVGVNGISNESLLAVLIDRMKGFVDGPYSCEENVEALRCLIAAKQALHKRTEERVSRGVEGTSAQ